MAILFTPSQVRAALGLIGWNGTDLAEKIGVSKQMVSNYLSGKSALSAQNLEKIAYWVDRAGVEFSDYGGVRPKQSQIRLYRGQKEFWQFFDDIYEMASTSKNADLCATNVVERLYDQWLAEYEPVHAKRMTALSNYRVRVLLKEGDQNMTSTEYATYRWSPASQFSDVSLYLYGDKSAFIEFLEHDVAVTVVENPSVTKGLRKMFDTVWTMSAETPHAS